MAKELMKRTVLMILFMGSVRCLLDDEWNSEYDHYISPIINEANFSKPENFTCTTLSPTEIHLTWDPPVEGLPQYYAIEWIWPGGYEKPTPTIETEYIMADLLPCTHYTILVSCSDGDSESEPAEEKCTTFNSPVPWPPTEVQLTSSAPDQATVEWDSPLPNCGYDSYSVVWEYESLWGEESGDGEGFTGPLEKIYIIKDLVPYSNVTACVSAKMGDTDFGELSCASGITMQDCPGPPTILSVTQDQGKAEVTWKPPDILNGVLENYTLTWKSAESEENITVAGNVLSHTLTLELCETYNFSVSAKTAAEDWGLPSNKIKTMISNYIPADNVVCSTDPDGSVTVSWILASSGCLVTGFHAEYNWTSLWSDDHGSNSQDLGPENMELKVRDILPYSRVNFCLGVGDKLDDGGCCTTNTAQQVPGPPENMTLGDIIESAVNVTWSEPTEINGVLGSWILSVNIEDEEVFNDTLLPETRPYELEDIRPDADYNITLQASTETGFGDASFCIINNQAINDDEPNLGAILGGTIGALLCIVLIIAAVFFGRKWKARKSERKHNENRKERKMTQTPERNAHKANNEEVKYDTKTISNIDGKQYFNSVTSRGYDNHNFKMPSSDTSDDQPYRKPLSKAHDNLNYRRSMPEALNNNFPRRHPVDIDEMRNFRRPLEDIDEISDDRRPSADTRETRNFRRVLEDNNEMNNVKELSTDVYKRPLARNSEMKPFRWPSRYTSEIQDSRRPSSDTNEWNDFSEASADISEMQKFTRPSTNTNQMQNLTIISTDVHDTQNFNRPTSPDYENLYFRKPSPLAHDSRNFRKPAQQTQYKKNLKRPAPQPNNQQNVRRFTRATNDEQNFIRPIARSSDEQNLRRPSSDFNDDRDSKVSLSGTYKDEDSESVNV